MDSDALRLFLHLARTLHFTRTSRECNISLSALSRTVQRLEAEVGQPLFLRDRRSVSLTSAGELFREYAADALSRLQVLRQRMEGTAEQLSGTIRIFASVTAVQSFLPRILTTFRRTHPEIHIELETGYALDALARLEQGAVDVSVAALPARVPPNLEARVVVVTPLVFVAPASECEASRLVERRPVPWGEVPMVLPASGLARAAVDRWFARRKLHARLYGEVAGNEAILSLVSLGCGVGVVPRLVADKSPLRGELQVLEVEPRLGEFRVGVCTEKRSLKTPLVRAFWDSIDEARA
ncbi:MAG TPA: HTH-type transcriptional activator IlvY [Polyangiaceae bacterium]|nr:HTH-type transcriptional activator IlvY [Polyangiaceae bacterium]